MSEFKCTVVSYVPVSLAEYKPALFPGFFQIKASDTITPELLIVDEAIHNVYLDSSRGSLPISNSSEKVARSIVRDFIDGQMAIGDDALPAIFFVPGIMSIPKIEDEYAEMIEKRKYMQRKWMIACCKIADDDWKRYQKHNVISDVQRKFANILGYRASDHPWMVMDEILEINSCPMCKTRVERDQVICLGCKYILRPDLYTASDFAGTSISLPVPRNISVTEKATQ